MSFQKYESYGKIRSLEYLADTVEDLKELPKSTMGSTCYVISNATNYMCNSQNEWIPQNQNSNGENSGGNNGNGGSNSNVDLSNYMTKAEVEQAIADATANLVRINELNTLNGESLIGSKDLNIATLIPDEDIVTEAEVHEVMNEISQTVSDALTIKNLDN